jgi:hypothetical protein
MRVLSLRNAHLPMFCFRNGLYDSIRTGAVRTDVLMAFCVDCGAQAPASSKFCRNCGAQLRRSVSADEGAEPTVDPPVPMGQAHPMSERSTDDGSFVNAEFADVSSDAGPPRGLRPTSAPGDPFAWAPAIDAGTTATTPPALGLPTPKIDLLPNAGVSGSGWAIACAIAGALTLLGGALPLFAGSGATLIDSTSGAIFIAGLTAAFAFLAVDIGRGSRSAIAGAAGVGTMVISLAGYVVALLWLVDHHLHGSIKPGSGGVSLFLAGLGSLVIGGGAIRRLGGASTSRVNSALAVGTGIGGIIATVGLCIPPISGESIHEYLFAGPGFVNFWIDLPIILTALCALAPIISHRAGATMLALGNAAGLLVLWGGAEVARAQSGQVGLEFINGSWAVILIGLVIVILAGAVALSLPAPDSSLGTSPGGMPATRSIMAMTPIIFIAAAVVIVPLAIAHHNVTSTGTSALFASSGAIGSGGAGLSDGSGSSSGSYGSGNGSSGSSGDVGTGTGGSTSSQGQGLQAQAQSQQLESILEQLLSQSGQARNSLQSAIDGVENCSLDPSGAATTANDAATTRQNILGQLENFDASQLPNGSQLIADLNTALSDSIQSDNNYQAWMEFVAETGCNGQAQHDANYSAAQQSDVQATAAKQVFVNLWNPIARRYGYPTLTNAEL